MSDYRYNKRKKERKKEIYARRSLLDAALTSDTESLVIHDATVNP
jgi:hypothetical protein